MRKGAATNRQPRLIGFLCKNGAYAFYDHPHPVLRKLPASFIGMPVANVGQVQSAEILKAFLSGADGVLIAGCEVCRGQQDHQTPFSEMMQALSGYGIERSRVRMEWIAAGEDEKFLRVVNEMMQNLRGMPALHLPAELRKNLSYCG